MAVQREVAHRVFAAEFNSSRVEVKGTDEKAPSYLISPLGAKMNRVFLCGVLTEVENRAQDGEMWRARISDPTGVFTVYAGQYQPEASAVLSGLNPPQYVAVVGKCRTYEPEPGSVFVSVRPESITVVDEEIRNNWVFEAAKQTRDRIAAFKTMEVDEDGLTFPTQGSIQFAKYGYRIAEIGASEPKRIGGVRKAHNFYTGLALLKMIAREFVRPVRREP